MAKENKYPPAYLFGASALLLTGGWLMASFPLFIFLGLAPLFALTDRADNATAWEKMEWVLLALTISFLAVHAFDFSYIISSMVMAILFTLTFIGHLWVRQTLGKGAGKITLLFFWLSLEYLLLKTNPQSATFLADAVRLQPDWTRWNLHTGYLGASCWILFTNWMVYEVLFSARPFQWYWIVLMAAFLAGPVAYSYYLDLTPLAREDMLDLYTDKVIVKDVTYIARGEFVVRTAAWVSTLMLLFTLVRNQTNKR